MCEDLKMREPKPPIIANNALCMYNYKCDLCDAEYVGYTSRHLHQRIDEHRHSVIGNHLKGYSNGQSHFSEINPKLAEKNVSDTHFVQKYIETGENEQNVV